MKKKSTTELISFRTVIRTAARVARRRAFSKGFPVAISKNGKVVLIYKDKREVVIHP
jgi:hypothetical protein